jgi:uncharacterized protein (DUF1778 family)
MPPKKVPQLSDARKKTAKKPYVATPIYMKPEEKFLIKVAADLDHRKFSEYVGVAAFRRALLDLKAAGLEPSELLAKAKIDQSITLS